MTTWIHTLHTTHNIPSNIQMPNLAQVAASMLTIRYTLRMMLRVGINGTGGTLNATKLTDCGCLWMEIRRRERMMVTIHTKTTSKIPRPDPSFTPLDMRSLPFAIIPQNTKENTPIRATAPAVTELEDLVGILMSVWLNSCLHRGARLSSLAFTRSSSVCLYLNRIT